MFFNPKRDMKPPETSPDEVLVGKCMTCQSRVESRRGDCSLKSEWREHPSTGCPSCGAVVYLFPDAKATSSKLDEALKAVGALEEQLAKEKKRTAQLFGESAAKTGKLQLQEARIADLEAKLRQALNPHEGLLDRMEAALREGRDMDMTEADLALLGVLEAKPLPPVPDVIEEDGD